MSFLGTGTTILWGKIVEWNPNLHFLIFRAFELSPLSESWRKHEFKYDFEQTIVFKQWWFQLTIPLISTKRKITSHLNSMNIKKRPWHMTFEIQVLAWDRHTIVTGLNYLMGPQQTSITYIWDIKSYYKNLQCRLIKSPMTNLGLKYNPKQIFTWII